MPDVWGICRGLFRLARSPAALPRAADLARFAFAVCMGGLFKLNGSSFLAPTPHHQNLEKYIAKSRSQNRFLEGAICTFFGNSKGGVHDPRHMGPIYIEDWPLGVRCSELIETERIRDSNGFLFKPNGVTPPVGLVPVRG